jgi:hypothetical protein
MAVVDEKTCPMCGETIKAAARICRYCGERVDDEPSEEEQERIEAAAKKILRQRHESTTALQLFLTGLIACMSPICAIYGVCFLLMHRDPFPRKWMAVAGTILHWIWTAVLAFSILMSNAR